MNISAENNKAQLFVKNTNVSSIPMGESDLRAPGYHPENEDPYGPPSLLSKKIVGSEIPNKVHLARINAVVEDLLKSNLMAEMIAAIAPNEIQPLQPRRLQLKQQIYHAVTSLVSQPLSFDDVEKSMETLITQYAIKAKELEDQKIEMHWSLIQKHLPGYSSMTQAEKEKVWLENHKERQLILQGTQQEEEKIHKFRQQFAARMVEELSDKIKPKSYVSFQDAVKSSSIKIPGTPRKQGPQVVISQQPEEVSSLIRKNDSSNPASLGNPVTAQPANTVSQTPASISPKSEQQPKNLSFLEKIQNWGNYIWSKLIGGKNPPVVAPHKPAVQKSDISSTTKSVLDSFLARFDYQSNLLNFQIQRKEPSIPGSRISVDPIQKPKGFFASLLEKAEKWGKQIWAH